MSDDEMHENRPETRIEDRRPEDLIKIMLATDCHIGVHERDPVRGQDSINSFREVLQLAKKHDVDFILLAGDLFHENRPSRESLYQTISLLREYTLGDKPVSVELLSDPDDGKAPGYDFPAINYEDPNFNIAIPVFSIHGNHDDPQGAGGYEGALCALDMLSVTGLINYIGKIDIPTEKDADGTGMMVKPVLLQKGESKLAMYGVGNVKDQRMHHQLRSNKMQMFTPKEKDQWFNIMLLHQNRVKRGAIECVPEGMFDDSIDLIIWGHEHDCRIEPEPVAGKRYFISQPGSTVATSLAEGESLTKHCALLEVQGKSFQITPIPLRTVRPFKMDTVHLFDVAEAEDINLNDRLSINSFLKRRITELIKEAKNEFEERNADAEERIRPMLPLVDTTNVPEMTNPQRLGLEFQGKIANPRDVLSFTRSKAKSTRNMIQEPELDIDKLDIGVKEKLKVLRVGDLVQQYLGAQELQLLGADRMNDAIEKYVSKEVTDAISSFVRVSEQDLRKNMPDTVELNEKTLDNALATAGEVYVKDYQREADRTDGSDGKGKKKEKKKAQAQEDAASVDSMLLDDNDDIASNATSAKAPAQRKTAATRATPAPAAKAASKSKAKATTATTRGKGKKVLALDSDEEENFDDQIMNIDSEEDSFIEEDDPKPKKAKPKAAPKAPAAKKAPAPKTKKSTQTQISFVPSRSKATKKLNISDSD